MQNPRKTPKIYPVDPDKELLVWEKWVTIRKEETLKLSKHTRRPPADLVLNLYDNVRPDKERKTVLEEAKIPEKVGVRGTLWEQPIRLRQRCYCDPVYEVHRTPAEMGRPRIVEHIGVPTEIQVQEMGYTGLRERIKCDLLDNEYHQYRDKREKELQEKILMIDPFRPEIGTLMVRGINPPPPPKKVPPLPEIKEILDNNTTCENLSGVFALRINKTIFIKNIPDQNLIDLKKMQKEPWHERCTSWTYYFNIPINKAGRGKLYLQNLGTVTVRYCWKKLKKSIPFIPDETEQMFFFNKNEDVLAPGQDKYINFTFLSDKPCTYKEYWELSLCNVNFFDTLTEKLVVNLHADSVDDYKTINKAIAQLKSDINVKCIKSYGSKLIDEAISEGVAVQPQMYPYKDYFLEAEMFVMKNPVCFYHQTEVQKMKELYAEMNNGNEWDLSITSWRQMMLKKEFDDRMKYFELLRKSYRDFLKPWYEGDELLKSKYRAMRMLLGQLADKFDAERDCIDAFYNPQAEAGDILNEARPSIASLLPPVKPNCDTIHNLFLIKMYDHIGYTLEACAGILSSLDLDRWIEFDFCQM